MDHDHDPVAYLVRLLRVRVIPQGLRVVEIHAQASWQNGDSLARRISLEGMSLVSVCFDAFGCASEYSL